MHFQIVDEGCREQRQDNIAEYIVGNLEEVKVQRDVGRPARSPHDALVPQCPRRATLSKCHGYDQEINDQRRDHDEDENDPAPERRRSDETKGEQRH